MTVRGRVTAISGGLFRVSVDGTVSGLIPALASACRLEIDFEGKTWRAHPPQMGDQVLCWFPEGTYGEGGVVGILESGKGAGS